ncbi:MAG: RES family NAD+ phosphorylase [Balneolales bacterium]
MELFRISRTKYGSELTGKGAALKGARWNSVGVEVIYTATNRSLAMAEVAVHIPVSMMPDDSEMLTLYVPDDLTMTQITPDQLKSGWNMHPPLKFTQLIGDQFILNREFCLMKVPSAVTKGDYNMMINPHHPEFQQINIVHTEEFMFDRRLFE